MLFLILNNGRAFATVTYNGVSIPMYAGYAIGFRELSHLLVKCSLIQFPFLLLFTVCSIAFILFLSSEPLLPGVVMGLKAAFLICAGRLLLIPFSFSSCTNDASYFRLRRS